MSSLAATSLSPEELAATFLTAVEALLAETAER
jgi:hypothetical protein